MATNSLDSSYAIDAGLRAEKRSKTALMGALEKAVPIATLVFVVSSMVAMGLGLKVAQITAPLRNLRLVSLSLLANFVLMPAAAAALAQLLRLDEPFRVGLLPLAVALAVNAKWPGAAARAKPLFDRLSSLGLILVVVLLVVVNFNKVLSVFGTRAILAGMLFIAFGYAVGWA